MTTRFFVSILSCADGEYYTGLTDDLSRQMNEHSGGECRSTAYRLPVRIIWYCCFPTKEQAAKFEKYLKSHSGRRFRDRFLKK